jgi:WD40 repeat protein
MDLSVASSTSSIGDSARKQSLASTPSVLYSPVAVRNITGVCHASNRRAMDWSAACGLIAYGSHALVVVIDPVTLQCVQVLEKHKQSVVRVAWCVASCTAKHPADKLTLASADAAANIIIWNVKSGDAKITLSDTAGKGVSTAPTSSAPVQMAWMDGRVENTAHLLAVLYPPFNFVLWDTNSGAQIWKKTYIETLQGFDMDPFDCSRVAFRCLDCVLIIDDFSTTKAPSANVSRKFYVLGASKTNQGLTSSKSGNSFAGDSKTSDDRTRTKIKRIVRELVTGESQAASGSDATPLSECLQVKFHGAVRNHLLLVYPREVLVLDLDIAQTVGTVATVERNCPAILQISSCWQRDVIFTLNEIGAVAMRVRRKIFTLAATPMEPIRSMSKSVSSLSVSQVPGDNLSDSGSLDAGALEIAYDVKASSETIRLNKNAKIMGMCCNPMSERNIAVFTTDGRIIFYDVLPQATDSDAKSSESTDDPKRPLLGLEDLIPAVLDPKEATPLRLYTNGTFCGLATPPFVIRMCPPLTVKNMNDYSPLLALGAGNGNIQIVNMSTGRVEREFAVHTFPVRGIEWTGLHSMLSHAHQNLSGSSALVRNELIHTDVRTGKSASLRTHRSEETPIDMLRVSHLKQYFIVAFVGAPFELWDLRTMTLLRTMPKKFPPITALDWSPLHNLKSLKKRMNTIEEKDSGAEGKTGRMSLTAFSPSNSDDK